MKITCLAENTSCREDLGFEHGLSFYAEAGGRRVLFDMGAGSLFLNNAKKLGIDLSLVDLAVLSHGHSDHGGGLSAFLEINGTAPIYVRCEAFGDYYSQKADGVRYIGLSKELERCPQIVKTDALETGPEAGIILFSGVTGTEMSPESNRNLKEKLGGELISDRFLHEQNMILMDGGKSVLFAGCAHKGILNIMERCRQILPGDPDAVIGGFHLNSPTVGAVEPEYIDRLAERLSRYSSVFYTCHCTGHAAFLGLKERLSDRIHEISVGGCLNI